VFDVHRALLHQALLRMRGLVMLKPLRATVLEPYPVLQPTVAWTLMFLQICTAKVFENLRDSVTSTKE
jgi:hypothetical protein